MDRITYRKDIDGLRAIAVLSVVGFHAFPFWVTGGFIGVDVFFVISGYLISTIIFRSLESGTFSFVDFYGRRIRRIFPALSVILIASYAFGWFALLADEYMQLGKHIAAGAGFVSNFVLWSESGYFDNSAGTKPLLHLWSLGIEEQFYIGWPLLLWVAWKQRLNVLIILLAIAIASFSLNVFAIYENPVATFYSPQTRLWELLVGALLASLSANAVASTALGRLLDRIVKPFGKSGVTMLREGMSIVGAALIVSAELTIKSETPFPGWWALLPTTGTALAIAAGPQAWINRMLLSNRILVWIGLISFPLYLWHWPLLSFARIVENHVPSGEIRMAAATLSILFAWLTFRIIERPIRYGERLSEKTVLMVLAMLAIGIMGYVAFQRNGFDSRLEEDRFLAFFENSAPQWRYSERIGLIERYKLECSFNDNVAARAGRSTAVPRPNIDPNCYERVPGKNKAVFLWGDSYAQQLYYGLSQHLPPNWQVQIVASESCSPSIKGLTNSHDNWCIKSNWSALNVMSLTKPDVAVVAQRDGQSLQGMEEIARKLKASGIGKVIFVGPPPTWTDSLPKIIAKHFWVTKPLRISDYLDKEVAARNEQLSQSARNATLFEYADLIRFFCNESGCLTRVGEDIESEITAWDGAHLTPAASDYLAKHLLANRIVD